MSFETIRILKAFEGRVMDQFKILNDSCKDTVAVQSGNVYEAAIQDGSGTEFVTTGALDQVLGIRNVLVQTDTATRVQIAVTFSDNTVLSHITFGGSYTLSLNENNPPIVNITVTELDGTATAAVINYSNLV